ncbi:MAG: hypothetical protein ACR2GX_06520 [Candidatus Dormibacteria bacterium]
MPKVVHVDGDDEIAELIEKIRATPEREVALVLPPDAAVFQAPLNIRLLSQFASKDERALSIVSDDTRIHQLARNGGFPVFASVAAWERGIPRAGPGEGVADAPHAGAIATAPPPAIAAAATPAAPPAPPGARRRVPAVAEKASRGRRRPLYFALIGLGIIGLLLFLVLSPSAKIVVTLNATPVSVSPTIQGTPDQAESKQPDHILTQVATTDASAQFQATASGQKQIPATNATTQVVITIANPANPYWSQPTSNPFGLAPVPKGYRLVSNTNPPVNFQVSQPTVLTFTKSNPIAGPVSNPLPVVSLAQGKGQNVSAHSVVIFGPGEDPCSDPLNSCTPGVDFKVDNPQPAGGGTDAKTVTVVSADNVTAWNTQVATLQKQLTDKVNADLVAKEQNKEVATDPNGGGKTIASDVQPSLPKADDSFPPTQITVSLHAKATFYSPADVRTVLLTDLQALVPTGDTLIPEKLQVVQTSIIQAGDDGHLALSVTATDYHRPDIHFEQLKDSLTGKSLDDVRKIISHRVDRVQSVDITETPVQFFFMPLFASRIQIDENFVTPPTKSTP